jgi:hypothetical protein
MQNEECQAEDRTGRSESAHVERMLRQRTLIRPQYL